MPIACSLTADDRRERARRWHALVGDAIAEPVEGGLAFALPSASAPEATALAAAEVACCPFFAFRLAIDADGMRLEARAPESARALVEELFGGR